MITDPADMLPFSRDIIIAPGEIIPKDPIPNELSLSGTLKPVRRKKALLFVE